MSTLKLQWEKINSIPHERFCLQRLLNIIIHFVALESWKKLCTPPAQGRKKVWQKMPMVNECSCREAERTSFWSAKLFWEQVLLLNRPRCSALQKAAVRCEWKEERKASLCLTLQGKCSRSIYPCDLKSCICQKLYLLKSKYQHIHVCGCVHTHHTRACLSLTVASPCAWILLILFSCLWELWRGTRVLITFSFFTQYNFISLQNCFSTYLLLFWLYCCSSPSSCSFGDKYI